MKCLQMYTIFNHISMDNNLCHSKCIEKFFKYFVWSTMDKMWAIPIRGHVIRRAMTCHPIEGERYYLRLLLMNIRGPKSYQNFLTINGKLCTTFRKTSEK
ncbi:hypothetical protein H5410_002521 [Solanum commersonii]|uniref:Uncharacterized protein n=1 Tax=Solanum commersonii TaxID=4109 RepID=A0A9J6B2C9_SOLCO|nr:hypothetical protein H5410_002521 [Solanum commersonii]